MRAKAHQTDYKRRFEEAIRLRDSGQLARAESLLRTLLAEQEGRPEALLILGGIQYSQGRFSDSAEAFAALVEDQPSAELASLGLFHSLWELDQKDDAFAEMRRYLDSYESEEYSRLHRDLKAEGIDVPF